MSESLTSLKKIKTPLLRGQEHSIRERTKELGNYREEKLQLIKQIQQLGRIFFQLKQGKKVAEKAVGVITTERLKTLEYLAREVSSELEADAGKLQKKSKKLDKRDIFLQGLSEYLSKAMKITESLRLEYDKKATKLDLKLGEVLKEGNRALELTREAQDNKERIEVKLNRIDENYKKADKLARWFEEEAEKEKFRLEVWAKTVNLREKKAKKQKELNKEVEKENNKREGWLDDREKTVGRTIVKIKKQGFDIIV